MIHLDLFSGIGGFAYAADQVWGGGANVQHVFVEFDPFCQEVLKKHWPESEVHGDIRTFTTNTNEQRHVHGRAEKQPAGRPHKAQRKPKPSAESPFLLTGGFPCQPFSNAGLRRGTADDRHLWPEMLRVIRSTKPQWVIAENVGGILSWNEGLVFEQVCADMEVAGYTVQPFIIPAVAVNAPHRRDRVWFIGHAKHDGQHGAKDTKGDKQGNDSNTKRPDELRQPKGAGSLRQATADSERKGRSGGGGKDTGRPRFDHRNGVDEGRGWNQDWLEVATRLCSVDDGLPAWMGNTTISASRHRKEQLKAYGNAIVPQVAVEIMRGMR